MPLCFAVIVMERYGIDYVVDAANVAKWMIGKPWEKMALYWRGRKATIIKLVFDKEEPRSKTKKQ